MNLRELTWRVCCGLSVAGVALAQEAPDPASGERVPDYPPAAKVLEGFTKLVSKSENGQTFYTVWQKGNDQLLAELPKDFRTARQFIALTVASGESYAGLQAGEVYVYWKQYDKKLALVQPNLEIRSTGDKESQDSVKRLFTDRVLLEVPIVTWIPKGGPVIDLDAFLLNEAPKFFGSSAAGVSRSLFEVKTAKVFEHNVEIGIEAPATLGQLREFHYSISRIPDASKVSYKPRQADPRIGYFTTYYSDFGQFEPGKTRTRFINRWHLEKADPKLKLSPPKEPIKFYVEHTTPIRYRRWVKDGVELWNKAFENVGLVGAIEVYFQDAASGAHMEKEPEDVNYNFVRWLNNGIGTAIGPSRVHPETGQILDADIILTDGWIRHWWQQYNEVMPDIALEGYAPETLAWLHKNPDWDPRVRLAPPSRRQEILERRLAAPFPELGGHPVSQVDGSVIGDQEYDGLMGRFSQVNGLCQAANCKTHGIAMMQMALDIAAAAEGGEGGEGGEENKDKDKDKDKKKEEEQMVDGIPESFIGPLLVDLVAHEVGHTLGLRHNFKGSSIYTYEEINSGEVKGKKPFAGSVMDYIPINIVAIKEREKGDYGMIDLGPYDEWAIEYGYSFENDLKPILDRVAEPQLQYATDEDTWGPDPLARRYDFGKDPLDYANNQMALAREHRAHLIDKFVKDGESWAKARRGYELTLRTQTSALSMMANWVGGTHVYRDFKGDPNGRAPIEVVPAATQRAALQFVVDNAFVDEAFGLTPEMIRYLTVDKWWDMSNAFDEPGWPVHDRILGIQASAMTALLNPTVLGRVYDNEFRVPADEDALTLPEVLETIRATVWRGLDKGDETIHTARKPFFSSLQRNLQREHVDRLIDLTSADVASLSPAFRPISDLATDQLNTIRAAVDPVLAKGGLDPYSRAHLRETSKRIEKALNAEYVIPK